MSAFLKILRMLPLLLLLSPHPSLAFLHLFPLSLSPTIVQGPARVGAAARATAGLSWLRSPVSSPRPSSFRRRRRRSKPYPYQEFWRPPLGVGAAPTTAISETDDGIFRCDDLSLPLCAVPPPLLCRDGGGAENDADGCADDLSRHRGAAAAAGSHRRRDFLASILTVATTTPFLNGGAANALPFRGERRQLEFCLVTVLRMRYWASSVAASLRSRLLLLSSEDDGAAAANMDDYQRKQPYLEARLGAKALLTSRVGGGSNVKVYNLSSLQLRGCLEDGIEQYRDLARSGEFGGGEREGRDKLERLRLSAADLVESLGSLVEFDGLETTTDASPRSSLMLDMYNRGKGLFVYRTLAERVVPACDAYVNVFGRERRDVCERFVRENYPEEMFEV